MTIESVGRSASGKLALLRMRAARARSIQETQRARLKVVKRIVRCAATEVDPDTAIRDLEIPKTLLKTYGHAYCGVYAEVVGAGEIALGDAIRAVG